LRRLSAGGTPLPRSGWVTMDDQGRTVLRGCMSFHPRQGVEAVTPAFRVCRLCDVREILSLALRNSLETKVEERSISHLRFLDFIEVSFRVQPLSPWTSSKSRSNPLTPLCPLGGTNPTRLGRWGNPRTLRRLTTPSRRIAHPV